MFKLTLLIKIVVDGIDYKSPLVSRFKIDLWGRTKSTAVLLYLQDIFIFKHRQSDDWSGARTMFSATSVISCIDRDLYIALL
jgi:hypothetical protein